MANFSVGEAISDPDEDDDSNTPCYSRCSPLPKRHRRTAPSTSNPGGHTTAAEVLQPIAVKEYLLQMCQSILRPTEAGVESTPIPNGKGEYKGPSTPVSLTLADPDLLDCPICFEPLCSPIYQCENGHITCGSCCTTVLKNKCSNCCLPIGNFRCRAIEQILESVKVTCQYMPYGCAEMFSYSKKLAHEKACNYVPCSCPYTGCDFVGISKCLYNHFGLKHKDSSKQFCFNSIISISTDATQNHVILREGREGVLFILNRCIETLGSFYNVVCVAPSALENIFSYELTAFIGEDSIIVKASVEMMSKWTARPPTKMSLFVPSNFTSTDQLLSFSLIIRKKPALAS